jgi:hypothetical protein
MSQAWKTRELRAQRAQSDVSGYLVAAFEHWDLRLSVYSFTNLTATCRCPSKNTQACDIFTDDLPSSTVVVQTDGISHLSVRSCPEAVQN